MKKKGKIFSVQKLFILIFIGFISFVSFFLYPQMEISAYSFEKPFIKPLEGEIIVSFRQEYHDIEKDVKRKHTGIDIRGQAGDSICAAGNGIISYCGFSPIGGLTLVVKHNEKIRSTYLNLRTVFVSPGDKVKQGHNI